MIEFEPVDADQRFPDVPPPPVLKILYKSVPAEYIIPPPVPPEKSPSKNKSFKLEVPLKESFIAILPWS